PAAGCSFQRLLDQALLQGGLLLQGRPGLLQVLQPGLRAPLVLAHLPGQVDVGLQEGPQQRVAALGLQQLQRLLAAAMGLTELVQLLVADGQPGQRQEEAAGTADPQPVLQPVGIGPGGQGLAVHAGAGQALRGPQVLQEEELEKLGGAADLGDGVQVGQELLEGSAALSDGLSGEIPAQPLPGEGDAGHVAAKAAAQAAVEPLKVRVAPGDGSGGLVEPAGADQVDGVELRGEWGVGR
ncbi:hypothetical protein Y956_07658, partial [Nipponia nippon]